LYSRRYRDQVISLLVNLLAQSVLHIDTPEGQENVEDYLLDFLRKVGAAPSAIAISPLNVIRSVLPPPTPLNKPIPYKELLKPLWGVGEMEKTSSKTT
jgi:hypothetical protein